LSEELRLLNRYTSASVGFAQQQVEPKDYRISKSNAVKQAAVTHETAQRANR
jgi:hypothetical protein